MAGGRSNYMLTATVRLAALHCSARKRRLQSTARAHAGVECPHTDVTVGSPQKGQPTYADVLTSGCVQSAGFPRATFTFPLICTVDN